MTSQKNEYHFASKNKKWLTKQKEDDLTKKEEDDLTKKNEKWILIKLSVIDAQSGVASSSSSKIAWPVLAQPHSCLNWSLPIHN